MSMFCYQCQEAAKGEACTVRGTCGKNAEVAALQDALIWLAKGLSFYAVKARELGITQKTVHNHLNAIYRRLDTQSLTHAVLSAVRLGIIDLGDGPDEDAA